MVGLVIQDSQDVKTTCNTTKRTPLWRGTIFLYIPPLNIYNTALFYIFHRQYITVYNDKTAKTMLFSFVTYVIV